MKITFKKINLLIQQIFDLFEKDNNNFWKNLLDYYYLKPKITNY